MIIMHMHYYSYCPMLYDLVTSAVFQIVSVDASRYEKFSDHARVQFQALNQLQNVIDIKEHWMFSTKSYARLVDTRTL